MKRAAVIAMVLIMATAAAFAGAKKKGGGKLDLSTVRTLTGSVAAVVMDYGLGHPRFTLNSDQEGSLTVSLGPHFFLVANDFSMAVGDQVSTKVANCSIGVAAFEVTDLTNGKQITLRSDDGLPLWTGGIGGGNGNGGGQNGRAPRMGGYGAGIGVNLSTLIEVEGPLTAVNFGLGTHNNTVTLQATATESYTVSMGPYWYMTQNGFAFQQGETVRIRMAQCQGRWVAFSVTRPTGEVLQLRDDQGVPLWLD